MELIFLLIITLEYMRGYMKRVEENFLKMIVDINGGEGNGSCYEITRWHSRTNNQFNRLVLKMRPTMGRGWKGVILSPTLTQAGGVSLLR